MSKKYTFWDKRKEELELNITWIKQLKIVYDIPIKKEHTPDGSGRIPLKSRIQLWWAYRPTPYPYEYEEERGEDD